MEAACARSAEAESRPIFIGEVAGQKVKKHLKNLMGTNIVKLNDRNYMLKLQEQVMLEYEMQMDKLEGQRSQKEKLRQRKLYIEGLQDTPYMDESYRRRALSVGAGRRSFTQSGGSLAFRSNEYPAPQKAAPRGTLTGLPSSIATSRKSTKDGREMSYNSERQSEDRSRGRPSEGRTVSAPAAANDTLVDSSRLSGYWLKREILLGHLNADETLQDLYDTADSLLQSGHSASEPP